MKRIKQKRNAKCACGSGRKYKVCCLRNDTQQATQQRERIIYGDVFCTPELEEVAETIKIDFPDHEVIDVSNVATSQHIYKQLQLQHFNAKVVMLLNRNPDNECLFRTRAPPHVRMMALYRGAYQCFDDLLDDVCEMIATRLQGKIWKDN